MTHHEVIVFLLQVAVMLAVALGAGQFMRRLGQPAVVGELLGGVLLGPTLFGTLAPELYAALFPTSEVLSAAFEAVVKLGMLFFLFAAGLEVNLSHLRGRGTSTTLTSIGGIVVPFGLGVGSVLLAPTLWGSSAGEPLMTLALFMGAALSITALPVIARILMELNLIKHELGTVIMVAATVNDLAGWSLFAIILSRLDSAGSEIRPLWLTVGLVLLFVGATLGAGTWMTRRLLPSIKAHLAWPGGFLASVTVAILLASLVAEAIGIHAFFGAFLVGVALGRDTEAYQSAYEILYTFAASLLTPLYFVSIGLRSNFAANFDLTLVLVVLGVASLGKIGGAGIAARLGGMSWHDAMIVGMGMNARGAMEIILATVALEAGLIDQRIFVALVIMAIVTSMVSGPGIKQIMALRAQEEEGTPSGSFEARVERVPQAVSEEVEGEHGQGDGKPREKDEVRRAEKLIALPTKHRPPFRGRGLRAEAEEGERRRIQDGCGDAQRSRNDQRRQRVGENAAEKDARVPGTERARGVHVLLLLDREARLPAPRAHRRES